MSAHLFLRMCSSSDAMPISILFTRSMHDLWSSDSSRCLGHMQTPQWPWSRSNGGLHSQPYGVIVFAFVIVSRGGQTLVRATCHASIQGGVRGGGWGGCSPQAVDDSKTPPVNLAFWIRSRAYTSCSILRQHHRQKTSRRLEARARLRALEARQTLCRGVHGSSCAIGAGGGGSG